MPRGAHDALVALVATLRSVPIGPGVDLFAGLERAMRVAENRSIFLVGREGFYPKLGSLTTGSGFAYGGGYLARRIPAGILRKIVIAFGFFLSAYYFSNVYLL